MENPFRIQKNKSMWPYTICLHGLAFQMTASKQAKTSGSEPLFELSCQMVFSNYLVTAFASLGERPECCVDFRGQLISLDFFCFVFFIKKKNDGGSILLIVYSLK